jgi:hypothetical protein
MQAFWDVLWSDVTALAKFVLPMLLLALPPSALGALFGAVGFGLGSWSRLARAIVRGVLVACAAVIVLGMLFEYGFRLEGLSNARRALRDHTIRPLWAAAIAVAFGAGFFAARRFTPRLLGSAPARRRFTLLQLFTAQLAIGLMLGWWVFTRREEIGYRSGELNWRAQIAADKALFGPYGWDVDTWDSYDQFRFRSGNDQLLLHPFIDPPRNFRRQPNVTDQTLELVAGHPRVTAVMVISDGVTDAGLKRLVANQRLWCVCVKSEQVTDAGADLLCSLPALESVRLHSDHLTGSILGRLAEVKTLRILQIESSQISPHDEAAFRAARPDVELRNRSQPW